MRTVPSRVLIGLAALVLCCTSAAHEFWIEVSAFRIRPGETISIRTLVGDGLPGQSRPRDPTKLERFEIAGPSGIEKVPGEAGTDPIGVVKPKEEGRYVIAYRSRPTKITLEAEKFNSYLAEEGLDQTIEARRAAGTTEKDGRERYSRCAKALIRVGDAEGGSFDRVAGFPFELIPEADPTALRAGDRFTVRAVTDEGPVPGVLVKAFHPSRPTSPMKARTDASGRAEFTLDNGGFWLISAVRMIPVKDEDCDWESYWASLTFELPSGADKAVEGKK